MRETGMPWRWSSLTWAATDSFTVSGWSVAEGLAGADDKSGADLAAGAGLSVLLAAMLLGAVLSATDAIGSPPRIDGGDVAPALTLLRPLSAEGLNS